MNSCIRKLSNYAKSRITNQVTFLILKNLSNFFSGNKVRFYPSQELIKVVVRNEEIIWNTHKSRMHLYNSGLQNRGINLGKSYLLQNIEFMKDDLVIDCGANMGDLQLYFRNLEVSIDYLGI